MVSTPITAQDAKSAVSAAFSGAIGREATSKELPLLMALVWLETGRGKSTKNNNLGNISASSKYSGDAWRPPWYDGPGPDTSVKLTNLHQSMLDGKAPSAFRSYDTVERGASDFVSQLKNIFPEVLEAAGTGNPTKFRDALAQKYSADYKSTSPATFANLAKEFKGSEPQEPKSPKGGHFMRNLVIGAGVLALGYAVKQTFFPPKKPKTVVASEPADGVLRPIGANGSGAGESNG